MGEMECYVLHLNGHLFTTYYRVKISISLTENVPVVI